MADRARIAVVGERDAVLAFIPAGVETHFAETVAEARSSVENLAAGGAAIIYVTERVAVSIADLFERYRAKPYPAIIVLPGGDAGIGKKMLRANAEKAIGADILFEKDV